MSRIILKSKYLKPKSKTDRGGFVSYIATRTGVVKNLDQLIHVKPTDKQKKLIDDLKSELPSIKLQKEFKAFMENPSVASASELIDAVCEKHYGEVSKKEDFVSYIAERPGVVKSGVHGLFGIEDKQLVLEHVKNEIKEHEGNIWTHVLSIKRDDAILTGFDTQDAWIHLLRKNHFKMAEAMKINPSQFRWYAAFHDTAYHPHVHIVMYSSDPEQGYLTNNGIEAMKSVFATEIFKNKLSEIYLEKDNIKKKLKAEISEMLPRLERVAEHHTIKSMMMDLHHDLLNYQGRHSYGYLPKGMKMKVDRIMEEIEKIPEVTDLMKKWKELIGLQYSIYSNEEIPDVSFVHDKTFRPLKNQIIKEAMNINEQNTDESTAFDAMGGTFSLLKHLGGIIRKNAQIQTNDLKSDKAIKLKTKLQKMALGQNENDTQQFS